MRIKTVIFPLFFRYFLLRHNNLLCLTLLKKQKDMKKFLTSVLTMAMMLFVAFPANGMAQDPAFLSVPLKKQKKEHNQELDPEGVRMPSRNIICLISIDEFRSDIDPDEILSYEVWDDTNQICKASFINDKPFCQYLFNSPGDYCIRISTADFVYVGFISTLM